MTRTGSKIAECNGIHFRRLGNLETDPFSCLLMSFGLCSWFQSPLNSFGNTQEPHHVLVDAFCVGLRQLWALAQPYGIENDDKIKPEECKMIGIVEIATATAATLAPYLPYVIKAGKAAGEKIAEGIGKAGGEAAWEKAGAIWDKIKGHFSEKPELEHAAGLVAMQPDDPTYQKVLAKTLASYLETRTDLRQDLLDLLGGEKAVQKVLADKGSWVEDVTQDLQGTGTQIVEATNQSVIKRVKQIRKS